MWKYEFQKMVKMIEMDSIFWHALMDRRSHMRTPRQSTRTTCSLQTTTGRELPPEIDHYAARGLRRLGISAVFAVDPARFDECGPSGRAITVCSQCGHGIAEDGYARGGTFFFYHICVPGGRAENGAQEKNMRNDHSANEEDLEAVAFRDGTHGNSPCHRIKQINGILHQKIADWEQAVTGRIRVLEATVHKLRRCLPDLQAHWNQVHHRIGLHPPGVALPNIYIFTSLGAMYGEVNLLTPALDSLGVGSATLQRQLAAAICLAAAAALAFGYESVVNPSTSIVRNIGARAFAAVMLVGLATLGVLREHQLVFAVGLGDSARLAAFLHSVPLLAEALFVILAIGIPTTAVVAVHNKFRSLADRQELEHARRNLRSATEQLEYAEKESESQRLELPLNDNALLEGKEQRVSANMTNYRRGDNMSALQDPLWSVFIKASVLAAVVRILTTLIFGIHSAIPAWSAVAALTGGCVFWDHRRRHRTDEAFKRQRRVHWVTRKLRE